MSGETRRKIAVGKAANTGSPLWHDILRALDHAPRALNADGRRRDEPARPGGQRPKRSLST
jgi:hypothetical protein